MFFVHPVGGPLLDATDDRLQSVMLGLGLAFWGSLIAMFLGLVSGVWPLGLAALILVGSTLSRDPHTESSDLLIHVMNSTFMVVFSFGYSGPIPIALLIVYLLRRR